MSQSLVKNLIHLTFSTKDRRPWISAAIRPELNAYMAGILRAQQHSVVVVNSVEDHAHILFNLSKSVALCDAVEEVKKSSSKWIKTQAPQLAGFHWQAGYSAFSVSQSNVETVRRYIENQEEHHRRLSFKDELRQLLKRHGMEFDERYLWD